MNRPQKQKRSYRQLQAAAEQYRQGEATLWEIASQLGLSYREAEEVLRTLGVLLVHGERPDIASLFLAKLEIDLEEIERQATRLRLTNT